MVLLNVICFKLERETERERQREREREKASSLAVRLPVLVSGQVFFTKKKVYSS